ncbi:MAG: hypothetical protein JWO67_6482 [Streptosporangiaceae bacterium]|nr:hypothetical protein [Streptosporangiaceae bacterium]
MGNIVTVEATAILQSSVAGTAYSAPSTPIKLALITNTTASTAGTAGSEVSGGSYSRQTIAWAAAAAGSIASSGTISFTVMPACTVAGIELWDSAGATRRWFGLLTAAKTLGAGDTISFAPASITISLS